MLVPILPMRFKAMLWVCALEMRNLGRSTHSVSYKRSLSTNVSYVHPAAVPNEAGSVPQYQGESNTDSFQGTLAGYLLQSKCI